MLNKQLMASMQARPCHEILPQIMVLHIRDEFPVPTVPVIVTSDIRIRVNTSESKPAARSFNNPPVAIWIGDIEGVKA